MAESKDDEWTNSGSASVPTTEEPQLAEDNEIISTRKKKFKVSLVPIANFWLSDHWLIQNVIANASRFGSGGASSSSSLLSRFLDEIPHFIIASLRGAGQVVFMNNPWSGLMILIGLFIQSQWIAFIGVIGLVSSTATCLLFGFNYSLYKGGIFGYNGLLVGLALATFDNAGENHYALIPLVIFLSCFSSLLVAALGDIMTSRNIPALTLPFNLAATMVLMGGANFSRFSFSGLVGQVMDPSSTSDSSGSPELTEYSFHVLLFGTIRGFGQVFLADNPVSGLLIMIGMFICSPFTCMTSVLGSFLGCLTGIWVGIDPNVVKSGLFSYNALLGTAAIHGVFYVPTYKTLLLSILCGISCALLGRSLQISFQLSGLPTMTYPFCIITIVFLLLQRSSSSTSSVEAVPLAHVTTSEIHLSRKIRKLKDLANLENKSKNYSPSKITKLRRMDSYGDGYVGNKSLNITETANQRQQIRNRPAMASRFPSFRSMNMDFDKTSNKNDVGDGISRDSIQETDEENQNEPNEGGGGGGGGDDFIPSSLPSKFPSFRSVNMDFSSNKTSSTKSTSSSQQRNKILPEEQNVKIKDEMKHKPIEQVKPDIGMQDISPTNGSPLNGGSPSRMSAKLLLPPLFPSSGEKDMNKSDSSPISSTPTTTASLSEQQEVKHPSTKQVIGTPM